MKKLFKLLLVIAIVAGIGYVVKVKVIDPKAEAERIAAIKKGWYIKITAKELRVRTKAQVGSKVITKVKKGDIFKCTKAAKESSYVWYLIEYEKGKYGWVANTLTYGNLEVYNSDEDLYAPIVKFFENVYRVENIESINYDHLELWDDSDKYEVTHQVYHEVKPDENIDQYWIRYTITDASGKSSSKTQKIEFAKRPEESKVKSFLEYPTIKY